jgi:hypothetical protein
MSFSPERNDSVVQPSSRMIVQDGWSELVVAARRDAAHAVTLIFEDRVVEGLPTPVLALSFAGRWADRSCERRPVGLAVYAGACVARFWPEHDRAGS